MPLRLGVHERDKQHEFRRVCGGESDERRDDFLLVIAMCFGVPDFRRSGLAGDRIAFNGCAASRSFLRGNSLESFRHLLCGMGGDGTSFDAGDGTGHRSVVREDAVNDVRLHHDAVVGDGTVSLDHLEWYNQYQHHQT